jgi:hypothetical protein
MELGVPPYRYTEQKREAVQGCAAWRVIMSPNYVTDCKQLPYTPTYLGLFWIKGRL